MTNEPRSPGGVVTIALTAVFTAGAGAIERLPVMMSTVSARAAAVVGSVLDDQPPAIQSSPVASASTPSAVDGGVRGGVDGGVQGGSAGGVPGGVRPVVRAVV